MKILTEIFCQKLIVSNVISAFLGHLKPKIFYRRPTMAADIEQPPPPSFFKISASAPGMQLVSCSIRLYDKLEHT